MCVDTYMYCVCVCVCVCVHILGLLSDRYGLMIRLSLLHTFPHVHTTPRSSPLLPRMLSILNNRIYKLHHESSTESIEKFDDKYWTYR